MHALNNRNYLEVTGLFNGTLETTFEVKVTGTSSNEQWAYRSKDTEDAWSSYSTAIDIDVGSNIPSATPLQLGTTGVYIEFTATTATRYQDGDIWSWSSAVDVQLDTIEGAFDYIETIDVGDTRNLLAISQGTGRIATIENIDSDNPIAQESDTAINLGGTSGNTLDFEKRNKEIYIAKGKDNPPQWLGYSKFGGWAGEGDLELKCVPALDLLTGSDNPETDCFDQSIVLRAGGGANLTDAKVIVGIKVDGELRQEDKVWVQNIPDKKLYEFGCISSPIAIKRWYGVMDGNYCDGFAVMRKANSTEHCVDIDLWDLNTGSGTYEGQQANMYNTLHIEKPESEDEDSLIDVGYYSDFLIVPKVSDMDHTDQRWTILLSRSKAYTNRTGSAGMVLNMSWLWSTGENTQGIMDSSGYVFTSTSLESITPRLFSTTLSAHSVPSGEMFYAVKGLHAGNDKSIITGGTTYTANMPDYTMVHAGAFSDNTTDMIPHFEDTAKYCLEFAGFNSEDSSYGKTPIIYFTARTQTPKSRGDRNWYNARACLTTSQQFINHANQPGSDSLAQAWDQPVFGPFMADNNGSVDNKVYRAVKWITYAMTINDDNTGEAQQKAFCHMRDWNSGTTQLGRWKTLMGSEYQIPGWLTLGGLGMLANKGLLQWDNIPSYEPNFGKDGRIIASTVGTKRQRSLLSYVRGGNRKLLHFRFGHEADKPQRVNSATKPQLFPNDWSIDAYTEFEGEVYETAYRYWNYEQDGTTVVSQSVTPDAGGIAFSGSVANSLKMKRWTKLAESSSQDDRSSYRACEHGNIVLHSGYWYPNAASVFHVMSVPWGDHSIKQFFKVVDSANTATSTNIYTSSASLFSMETPTETGEENSWSGISCAKVFYKASLIYDGYQESALISTTGTFWAGTGTTTAPITKTMTVEMKISDSMSLNDRITGIAVYRATSLQKDTLQPETLYRFIQEVPLYQFNHNDAGSYHSFSINDTGDAEGTYEAVNGVSEQIFDMALAYSVNTQQNGYHFVGNCSHPQIADAENFLFRSQPGKFSIFDWTKDFVQLPFIPVALRGFMGKVYAFSNSQVAVINPNNLFIEDVIEGTGCINSKTVLITDSGMMWCDYRNVYLASPSMKPIGDAILNVDTYGWLNIPTDNKDTVRCGYDSKRKAFLIFFTVTVDSTEEFRCWSYSTQKNRWDLFSTPQEVRDTALTKDGATILLLKDNSLAKFLSNTGNREDWYWESKKIQMGNTMSDKKVRNMKVEGNSRSQTTVKYKLDGDSSWKTGSDISSQFTGAGNLAFKLQTADRSKKVHWLKLRIDGDNTTAGTDIKAYATSLIYKSKRPK